MQNFAYFCEPVCKQLRLLATLNSVQPRASPRNPSIRLRGNGRRAEERKPSRSRRISPPLEQARWVTSSMTT